MSENKIPEEDEKKYYDYEGEDVIIHKQSKEVKESNQQKSVFLELIKQLKPGVELYRLNIPSFLLHRISLLEKISTQFAPNSILDNFETAQPAFRMLKVAGWMISQWRNVPRLGLDTSKPYNPIRGEVFKAHWDVPFDKSTSYFVAEQVSHHPPISAFYTYNKTKGYILDGHMEPKTSFSLNVAPTICEGRQTLNFYRLGEIYEIVPAQVAAGGILWGTKELMISGEFSVVCKKTGLGVKITFNHNACNGSLFDLEKKKKKLFVIDGNITDNVKVQDAETKKIYFLFQSKTIKTSPIQTDAPIHKQEAYESRRVWHDLTVSLFNLDYEKAGEIKNRIEQEQREIENERKKNNKPFEPKLFKKVGDDWVFLNPISQTETPPNVDTESEKLLKSKLQSFKDFKTGYNLPTEILDELKDEPSVKEETKILTVEEFEDLKSKILQIIEKKNSSSFMSPRSQETLEELQKQLMSGQINLDLD